MASRLSVAAKQHQRALTRAAATSFNGQPTASSSTAPLLLNVNGAKEQPRLSQKFLCARTSSSGSSSSSSRFFSSTTKRTGDQQHNFSTAAAAAAQKPAIDNYPAGAPDQRHDPAPVDNSSVPSVSTLAQEEDAIPPFNLFTPTDEHEQLRQIVREFAKNEVEPQALDFNRAEKFNFELFQRLGSELGLLGPMVSEKYGGAGFDAVAACIIHEELSYSDPAFCLSYLAHSLLFVHNLYHNGNELQKQKYLPKTISGEWIGGMGMSEPGAGTDVLGLKTKAIDKGDHYLLSGNKMWITNGCKTDDELGDVFLVYANTAETAGISDAKEARKSISLFLVEKNFEGFSLGQKIKDKCGMRASNTAELVFDNCKVPKENLVGDLHGGMVPMMRNLEIERIVLAAMSCGIARRAIDAMRKHARERIAFGKPIDSFGQMQDHIATSYAEWMASRSLLYNVAQSTDLDKAGQRIDSDAIKLVATKMATRVCDRAIQVHGGYGYVGEYVVERLWRDAKLLEIGGGTLEAHQKNIVADLASSVGDNDLPN
ncbi:unnamed protein product [Amoebophrya sp. A120]|nr:unnamed protein product [Amoebophrya sp. A120]|eukprot:GSA120T00012861001.1